MKKPHVSVVIPVYNGAQTLRKCLDSVLNQSYSNYEIIVVDNDSTDQTKSIIQEYERKFLKVRYIFIPHKNRGGSRNAGIRAARGEIIAMTDRDCVVSAHWIESLIEPMISQNEVFVMGSEYDLIQNRCTQIIQKQTELHFQWYRDGRYTKILDTKNFAVLASVIRKFMFNESMQYSEDLELAMRLREHVKIRYLPELKVGHYHQQNLRSWIKLSVIRGIWMQKIYKDFGHSKALKSEPLFEAFKLRTIFLSPIWVISQFFKRPFSEAYFILVSDISWKAGMLIGKIRF